MMRLLLLVILAIIPESLLSQGFHPPVTNYSPKDYGKDRNPENLCITQAENGLIYSGNANGVLEFDGTSWRFIPVLQGAYVTALLAASDGTIYVGTIGEFGKLIPTDKGQLVYQRIYPLIDSPKESSLFGAVWRIAEVQDGIIFQSEELIAGLRNNETHTSFPHNSYHLLHVFDDRIVTRDRGKGLVELRLSDSGFRYTHIAGNDYFLTEGLFGIIPTQSDSLLLVTHQDGLLKSDLHFEGIRRYKTEWDTLYKQALLYNCVPLLNNEYALTSSRNGLIIIDQKGHLSRVVDKTSGLRVSEVKDVCQDQEQSLWCALQNGIAHINYYSPLSYFDEETGIIGDVQAIIQYKGGILVGTSTGLFQENPSRNKDFREFSSIDQVPYQVWDFELLDDLLLIGTSEGLCVWNGKNLRWVFKGNVNAIKYIPRLNEVILAGNQGVYFLNTLNWQVTESLESPNNGVVEIVRSPSPIAGTEELWIGMFNQGVIRVNKLDSGWKFEHYDSFDGLYENVWVRPLVLDQKVYFGSAGSLLQFIDEETVRKDLPDSLKDDPMYYRGYFDVFDLEGTIPQLTTNLMAAHSNKIWLCQDNQLAYLDRNNGNKLVKHPFWGINFGRFNTFYLENDGTLWAGTAEGVIRFRENLSKSYTTPFETLIRSVTSGNAPVFMGAWPHPTGTPPRSQPANSHPEFDYSNNTITISYSAPYFEDNHKILYAYMLEGHDNEWSEWTEETKAIYTNLPEGKYQFRVKARNVYQTESTEATYSFSILPPWYRTTWAYILYAAGAILFIFTSIRISIARLRAKNIRLEKLVSERTAEIAAKNVELERQKNEILHQKTEIEDSINYARRIQEAILPINEEIEHNLPESFILFRPKDIVSGDFYWFGVHSEKQVLVCADCTGHGVPGAFMSMIGSDKLNQAVKQQGITNPSEILSTVNRGIKESLKQDEDKDTTRDGMDAAVLCFEDDSNVVWYAGANRALWLIRNNELIEYAPTKSAVGGFTDDNQVYKLHCIETQPGDCLYTTTDGFADQFGGEKGKKLKVKVLKDHLLEIHKLPMDEQCAELEKRFYNWMADFEQVDDVCIIGVRISI